MIAFSKDSAGFLSIIGYIIVFYGFLVDEFIFDNPVSGVQLIAALGILIVTVTTAVYKLKLESKL